MVVFAAPVLKQCWSIAYTLKIVISFNSATSSTLVVAARLDVPMKELLYIVIRKNLLWHRIGAGEKVWLF